MSDAGFTGAIPEVYDRCLGPTLFEPFAEALAARFRGFRGQILETAAGTGRVTRRLAEAAPEAAIVATDLNEPMLARAAGMVQAPNVKWRVADAQDLPFADDSFDAMVCQFGVMFYPDKAKGYAEARRRRARIESRLSDAAVASETTSAVVGAGTASSRATV